MKLTPYEAFAVALAAPVIRHQGGNERVFGGDLAREQAQDLLRILFRVENADDASHLLDSFAEHGQRAEWTQYATHVSAGWKPGPEDPSVARKAAFALDHRAELGERGLLGLDAMRSSAIAGWCERAGYLSHDDALSGIGLLFLQRTARAHRSFEDLAAQLRLAFGFTDGGAPPALDAVITSLLTEAGPWQDTAWPAPAKLRAPAKTRTKKSARDTKRSDPNRPLSIVAFALSFDCKGCGAPASVAGLSPAAICALCGTTNDVEPNWAYYLKDDFANRKRDVGEDDPITNDFGERYFSRRVVRKVEALSCACGQVLPTPSEPGDLSCSACGGGARVREADAMARSIDRNARLVVESVDPKPGAASFPCAACGARLTDASESIVRCTSCNARTFVDDTTWRAVHGPQRRRTTYVLLAW